MAISTSGRALRESAGALARAAALTQESPSDLLEFYATECRLKSAIVDRHCVRGWDDLPADVISQSQHHDLRRLAKALNLGSVAKDLIDCRRRAPSVGSTPAVVPISQVHSAWRYGAKLAEADRARLIKGLRDVRASLEANA